MPWRFEIDEIEPVSVRLRLYSHGVFMTEPGADLDSRKATTT